MTSLTPVLLDLFLVAVIIIFVALGLAMFCLVWKELRR